TRLGLAMVGLWSCSRVGVRTIVCPFFGKRHRIGGRYFRVTRMIVYDMDASSSPSSPARSTARSWTTADDVRAERRPVRRRSLRVSPRRDERPVPRPVPRPPLALPPGGGAHPDPLDIRPPFRPHLHQARRRGGVLRRDLRDSATVAGGGEEGVGCSRVERARPCRRCSSAAGASSCGSSTTSSTGRRR